MSPARVQEERVDPNGYMFKTIELFDYQQDKFSGRMLRTRFDEDCWLCLTCSRTERNLIMWTFCRWGVGRQLSKYLSLFCVILIGFSLMPSCVICFELFISFFDAWKCQTTMRDRLVTDSKRGKDKPKGVCSCVLGSRCWSSTLPNTTH